MVANTESYEKRARTDSNSNFRLIKTRYALLQKTCYYLKVSFISATQNTSSPLFTTGVLYLISTIPVSGE
jgi:hypothetical protein